MITRKVDFVVIGAGAAGIFGAARLHKLQPKAQILILEASQKVLSKVKVSGGGRCNVTHNLFDIKKFSTYYPRGGAFLRKCFESFSASDTVDWFAERGVPLVAEADGRMFPRANVSQVVIDCLLRQVNSPLIRILTQARVTELQQLPKKWQITLQNEDIIEANAVLVASGGGSRKDAFALLPATIKRVPPVPSLFTFNLKPHIFDLLPGVVANGAIHLVGTKLKTSGPLLITHWGLSGPAALKMSAWGAILFEKVNYATKLHINFVAGKTEDEVRDYLLQIKINHPKKQIANLPLLDVPSRLWLRLLELAQIPNTKLWQDIAKKENNKLIELLVRCEVNMHGKSTNKDEFVTAGGVDLDQITINCESNVFRNLFFAGEVLNIDGVTGGFNFQAAWSTAWVAATEMAQRCK